MKRENLFGSDEDSVKFSVIGIGHDGLYDLRNRKDRTVEAQEGPFSERNM